MEQHKFKKISSAIRRQIAIGDQSYLYFGGTAYLGIPQNKQFLSLYLEGLDIYGINNGTSRNNNVQLGIYDEAESHAAQLFGSEDALITSSGYLAAQLAVKYFGAKAEMIYAPNTHPSLWIKNAKATSFSFKEWAEGVVNQVNGSSRTDWILVSNSMNNLFPELYDFSFINQIQPDKRIVLIVDDSHGIAILDKGKGIYSTIPKRQNTEVVVVASMAKSLGVDAGVILASEKVISNLKNTHEFIGASPPAAAGLYAFVHAGFVYRKAYEKLEENSRFFNEGVKSSEFRYVSGFPVYLSADPGLADKLLSKKF